MDPIMIDTLIKDNELKVDTEIWRTRLRQALGGLLWTGITRYDLSYAITKIATDASAAVHQVGATRELAKLINKTTDLAKTQKNNHMVPTIY